MIGVTEPVCSPPPPYSPRRDPADDHTPSPSAALVVSPSDTVSPNTDISQQATPISAATTISPDFAPRSYSGRSPPIGSDLSPQTFAPPPAPSTPSTSSRFRSASRNHADRLLSHVTSRSRTSTTATPSSAIDALQHHTSQALSQTPNPYNNEPPRPPASRRAASTGGIGLANPSSNPPSRSSSQSRWEAGTPLPPPPPGPPPTSARSQSLNRTSSSENSGQLQGLAPASRTRDLHVRGTALGPVPPTPADWREESHAPRRDESMERPQLMQPLHIDTGSAVQHSAMATDENFSAVPGSAERRASGQHTRRDSSTSALFRTPAVRNRSAKGIRERRSESRNGRDRIVEPLSAAPREGLVTSPEDMGPSKPADLNLHKNDNLLTRRMVSKSSPRSGNMKAALDYPAESTFAIWGCPRTFCISTNSSTTRFCSIAHIGAIFHSNTTVLPRQQPIRLAIIALSTSSDHITEGSPNTSDTKCWSDKIALSTADCFSRTTHISPSSHPECHYFSTTASGSFGFAPGGVGCRPTWS